MTTFGIGRVASSSVSGMATDWMETGEAAELLGVTPAAIRKRIVRDAESLLATGDVQKIDAPEDDGGHRRWQIRRSLAESWRAHDKPPKSAKRDEVWRLREELELSRVESTHHEIALEHATDKFHRQQIATLESEIRSLRSQLAAAHVQVETLGSTVAALTRRATSKE